MKSISMSYAHWLGVGKDIERLVKQCDKCQPVAMFPARQEPVQCLKTEKAWT